MVDYNKRLVEVDEILNYLSEEDLLKIPEDVRKLIKDNKDKEYEWHYDETKPLKKQNVNRDTIVILSYLNMKYLLNEEQRKLMEQIHELNEKKNEVEKITKYDSNDIFKNKEKEISKDINKEVSNNQLIERNENIFTKIFKKIKKLLSF